MSDVNNLQLCCYWYGPHCENFFSPKFDSTGCNLNVLWVRTDTLDWYTQILKRRKSLNPAHPLKVPQYGKSCSSLWNFLSLCASKRHPAQCQTKSILSLLSPLLSQFTPSVCLRRWALCAEMHRKARPHCFSGWGGEWNCYSIENWQLSPARRFSTQY